MSVVKLKKYTFTGGITQMQTATLEFDLVLSGLVDILAPKMTCAIPQIKRESIWVDIERIVRVGVFV